VRDAACPLSTRGWGGAVAELRDATARQTPRGVLDTLVRVGHACACWTRSQPRPHRRARSRGRRVRGAPEGGRGEVWRWRPRILRGVRAREGGGVSVGRQPILLSGCHEVHNKKPKGFFIRRISYEVHNTGFFIRRISYALRGGVGAARGLGGEGAPPGEAEQQHARVVRHLRGAPRRRGHTTHSFCEALRFLGTVM